MIETLDIIKAIELAVEPIKEIKQCYTSLLPKGFKRPSILIEPRERKVSDASAHTVFIAETIRIITVAKLTEHGLVDNMELTDLQDKVAALFDKGKLLVGDRQLSVSATQQGRDFDISFLDITIKFYTVRREVMPAYPPMEHIEADVLPRLS